MTFVEMFHPEAGGIAKVPTSSVPHHETKGWVVNSPFPNVPDVSSDVPTDQPHEEN